EARLADQQQVPVVAQQVGAARDRARPRRGVGAFHADTVSQRVASWNPLAYGSLMQTEAAASWKQTACILCECNCGIEVRLGGPDSRSFERIRGDKAHPASQGYTCEKALRLDHYQNGRHRLTTPMRR